MKYAILRDGTVDRTVELDAEQYAALQVNGKAAYLRLWSVDPQPVPTAGEVVEVGPITVTQTDARQTWAVRAKTQAELEAEDLILERRKIEEILTDITTQRAITRTQWDAFTANQLRSEQWKDRQVLLRLANFLARRVRQEIA